MKLKKNLINYNLYLFNMIFRFQNKNYQTNLAGNSFNNLLQGEWKLCLINDNEGITDENSNYYETFKIKDGTNKSYRRLKNKNFIKMIDGERDCLHIIHWCPSDGYFCVTKDKFWDIFD